MDVYTLKYGAQWIDKERKREKEMDGWIIFRWYNMSQMSGLK